MLVVIRSLRWRPLRLRRLACRVLQPALRAWLVTLRLLCRGWLRLVMVALRSPVTRSRRLMEFLPRRSNALLLPARSLGSRTARLTRSLRWQLMLVVIRLLRPRPRRLRHSECRTLQRPFPAWRATRRWWCLGWLRLVMVALRSPVTRSRRLMSFALDAAMRRFSMHGHGAHERHGLHVHCGGN